MLCFSMGMGVGLVTVVTVVSPHTQNRVVLLLHSTLALTFDQLTVYSITNSLTVLVGSCESFT
jgi:hypothetical protein